MKRFVLIVPLLTVLLSRYANAQTEPLPVEVVATASEYVPTSTAITHPGHAYTNCHGRTSYLGRLYSYGDSVSLSGSADTNTNCETTFTLPRETTLTSYRKVNYTIARGGHALYLLSCTQTWKPSARARGLAALVGGVRAYGHQDEADTRERQAEMQARNGTWSECPAFGIGIKYTLTVSSTSDAQLEDGAVAEKGKPKKQVKLEYLGSASLPVPSDPAPAQTQTANIASGAKVHITSMPSGAEIFIDGKFYGNTPSGITVSAGEHALKVTLEGKEWSRNIQVTDGEINIHAIIPVDANQATKPNESFPL